MTPVTQPLREEHKDLLPHIESLRIAADSISGAVTPDLIARVEEAYDFLAHHLIPHATAEDRALYPVVQEVMGATEATATMSRDHVEVGRLFDELSELRARLTSGPLETSLVNDLRGVLYGLYTLVKVHFNKEEEVYLPLLDQRLTPQRAEAMFAAMEAAAADAKQKVS